MVTINWIINLILKLKPKKNYWKIAVPLSFIIIGEIVKKQDVIVQLIIEKTKDVENIIIVFIRDIVIAYLKIDLSTFTIVFLIILLFLFTYVKITQDKKLDNKINNISIKDSPNTIVQNNEKGDNIINQTIEEYKPKTEFLEEQSTEEIIDGKTKIKTTLIFGSKNAFPLTNPAVNLKFKNEFKSITGGVVGTSGMTSAGMLKREATKDNKGYFISTNVLQSTNYFYVEIISLKKMEFIEIRVKPK